MYQLIYTSAPRLLEAGKTGFGTIARSKELPRPLVSYLERLSTFDRSAGIPALQFYSTFRMGALCYRVFSQVMDCGVDYTRRTNHTAHHFVIQRGSAEESALQGSTPAGVMLALRSLFRRSWTGTPDWLPELSLPDNLCPKTGDMWQRLTGDAANARWLASSRFSGACCLSLDEPMEIPQLLALLHEGMISQQDHGWERAFSSATVNNLSSNAFPLTCLEGQQQQAGIRPRASLPCLKVVPGMEPPADVITQVETDFPQASAPLADVEEIVAEPHSFSHPSPQPWQTPTEGQSSSPHSFEPAPDVPKRPAVKKTVEESRNTHSSYIVGGIVAILALLVYTQRESHPASEKPSDPIPVEKPQPGKDRKPGTMEQNKGEGKERPAQKTGETPSDTSSHPKEPQKTAPVPSKPSVPPVSSDSPAPSKPAAPSMPPVPPVSPCPQPSPCTPSRSDIPSSEKLPAGYEQPARREQIPPHYEKHPVEIRIREGEEVFIFELRWEIDVSDIRKVMHLTEDAIFYPEGDNEHQIGEREQIRQSHRLPWSDGLKQKARQFRELQKKYGSRSPEEKGTQQSMSDLEKAREAFSRQLKAERENLEARLHHTPLRATLMNQGCEVYQLHIETIITK